MISFEQNFREFKISYSVRMHYRLGTGVGSGGYGREGAQGNFGEHCIYVHYL